jgi:hypothetical protein
MQGGRKTGCGVWSIPGIDMGNEWILKILEAQTYF